MILIKTDCKADGFGFAILFLCPAFACIPNYCCPVKTFSYGFREAGPLCKTHCKPRSGVAVDGQGCKWRFLNPLIPNPLPQFLFTSLLFTFLLLKTRLLYIQNKASFECKQGLFALQTRLVLNPVILRLKTNVLRFRFHFSLFFLPNLDFFL